MYNRLVFAGCFALLAVSLAAIFTGCKSQKQIQQENLASLQAQMASAQQDEDKACFAPLRELDKSGTQAALTDTAPKSATPPPNPLNTPACKTARDKYEQIGEQVAALQAKLAAH